MLCFDIESNGLLDTLTKIHVLVAQDTETGERMIRVGHQEIGSFLRNTLMTAAEFCGHNIIGFDIPALQKVFPWFKPQGKAVDTLVMSRVIYTNLIEGDMELRDAGHLPARLIGGHSLESWGYRLGEHKGEYDGGWEVCTPEMISYCAQDVEVVATLYHKLAAMNWPTQSLALEHNVQTIIQRQVRHGVLFDMKKAEALYVELMGHRSMLIQKLKASFGSWYEQDGKQEFVPKSDNKTHGYTAGAPLSRVKLVEFNPGSPIQRAKRLTKLYGWVPTVFTDKGAPKTDEKALKGLNYPLVPDLLRFLLIEKRIGMLAEGNEGWLVRVRKTSRLHGNVNTNGAVTGRMTHSSPNLAQVPKVKAGKDGAPLLGEAGGWGYECRSLFTAPKGKVLVGCDASGLELRMLAHFMGRYDGGAYTKIVLDGDIHSVNQAAAGLPTRDAAKTFIYAYLYGAGDAKIGSIIGKGADAGKRLKAKFLQGLPALNSLIDAVKTSVKTKGTLMGLDKRKLHIRSEHSALNALLQSAGALVMKQALVILDERLQKGGLIPGQHYEFVLAVHDEYQMEVDEDKADLVASLAVQSIVDAGKFFSLRCPLDGEAKIGPNWAETH